MKFDLTMSGLGLLFAAFGVLIGHSGLAAARTQGERRLTMGIALQAILIAFVVSRSSTVSSLGGAVILVLLLIQTLRADPSAAQSDDVAKETA